MTNDTLIMAFNSTGLGKFVEESVPAPVNDYQYTVFIIGFVLLGIVVVWFKFGKKSDSGKLKEDGFTKIRNEFKGDIDKLKDRVNEVEKLGAKIESIEHEIEVRYSFIDERLKEHKASSQNNFDVIYKKMDVNQATVVSLLQRN